MGETERDREGMGESRGLRGGAIDGKWGGGERERHEETGRDRKRASELWRERDRVWDPLKRGMHVSERRARA